VLLRTRGHALELEVIRQEIEVTVTVPESVLEWFVSVRSLKTGSSCSDWIDYEGYNNSSVSENEQEMCDDVMSFVTQLLERDLRYVVASESPSPRVDWLVDHEWRQAVPLTAGTLGPQPRPRSG
jgi:hypothetical protein